MSTKKFVVFLSLLAVLGMLLSACQPAATEEAPAAATEDPLLHRSARCCGRRRFDLRDRAWGGEPILWLDAGNCSSKSRRTRLRDSEARP